MKITSTQFTKTTFQGLLKAMCILLLIAGFLPKDAVAHTVDAITSCNYIAKGSDVISTARVSATSAASRYNWQFKDNSGQWKCFVNGTTQVNGVNFAVTGASSSGTNNPPKLVINNSTLALDEVDIRLVIAHDVSPCSSPTPYLYGTSVTQELHILTGTACNNIPNYCHTSCNNNCSHTNCAHSNCGHNNCNNNCTHNGCGHSNCGHNSCNNNCDHSGCGHSNCGHGNCHNDCTHTCTHSNCGKLKLGNQVWNDRDGDGKRDANEPAIGGATISLYRDNNSDNLPDGAAIRTTTTNSQGLYLFSNLTAGRYIASMPVLAGYQQSPNTATQATSPFPDNNVNDDNNLVRLVGPNAVGGVLYTNAITLTAGAEPTTDGDDANGNLTFDLAQCGNSFIGDFVWNDLDGDGIQDANEPGINGVLVTITFEDGRTATETTSTYNAANNQNAPQYDGYYDFENLGPGTYKITFATPAGLNPSPSNRGSNDAKDSDPVNGSVMVTIAANQSNFTIDAGFTSFVAPPPCPGATLSEGFENGSFTGSGASDLFNGLPRNGSYQIVQNVGQLGGGGYLNIQPRTGNYFLAAHTSNDDKDRIWYQNVTVVPGQTYTFCAGVTLLKNLGGGANFTLALYVNGQSISTGRVTFDWTQICGTYTAKPGETSIQLSIRDCRKGLFFVAIDDICFNPHGNPPGTLRLGNQVWNDYDGDGKRDLNEPGIPGAPISLYTDNDGDNLPDGEPIRTTVSDALGKYVFVGLNEGRYIASMPILPGYQKSPNTATQATSPFPDNNVDDDNNLVRLEGVNGPGGVMFTNAITLTAGAEPITDGDDANGNLTFDLAECGNGAIGDFVWNDLNANGIQDAGEPGINNVLVRITFSDGRFNEKLTINYNGKDGYYDFINLGPGTYVISFTTPAGLFPSPVNAGGDDAKDSDPVNGSVTVNLDANESDFTIDAGFTDKTVQVCKVKSTIKSKFNSNPCAPNRFVWFNSTIRVSGKTASPTTVVIDNATITFRANGVDYNLAVPKSKVLYSNSVTTPKTTFNATTQTWEIEVPYNTSGDVFGAGLTFPVPAAGLPANIDPVTWSADFSSSSQGLTIQWEWSAAVYSQFSTNYNNLTVATVDGTNQAGTPISYKNYLVSGGTGNGGSNCTGDRTPKATVTLCPVEKVCLGNYVWNDYDGDGIKDANEYGLSGVKVKLYRDNNNDNLPDEATPFASTFTNSTGYYRFANLNEGRYIASITILPGFQMGGIAATSSNPDNNVDGDNNAINLIGANAPGSELFTNAITLSAGDEPTTDGDGSSSNNTFDLALCGTIDLGDFVWHDTNKNGIQDAGEKGINGVEVKIIFPDGTIATKLTARDESSYNPNADKDGYYVFPRLGPGNFMLYFKTPSGYTASPSNQGGNDAKDSDPRYGFVAVTLTNASNYSVDAGFMSEHSSCNNNCNHNSCNHSNCSHNNCNNNCNHTGCGHSHCGSGTYSRVAAPVAPAATVAPCDLKVALQAKDPLCFNNRTGSIAATVTGNEGRVSYTWSNGATGANLANIGAGTYSLTIKDASGCETTSEVVTLNNPDKLVAVAHTIQEKGYNVMCADSKSGNIELVVTGGTGDYSYAWSNEATTSSLQNVGAGKYSVVVKDALNCPATASITLVEPASRLQVAADVIPVTCNADGAINLKVKGGVAPYTYQWTNNSTLPNQHKLAAGLYEVVVTDALGCSSTERIELKQYDLAVSAIADNNTLYLGNGTSAANLIAEATGGDKNYTYTWMAEATIKQSLKSKAVVEPTVPTEYTVVVKDGLGCSATATVKVNVVANPVAKVKALTMANIQVVRAMPNPSNGNFNVILDGFAKGKMDIRVLDVNGKEVNNKQVNLLSDHLQVPFTLSRLPKGIYFISVASAEGSFKEKIMIK